MAVAFARKTFLGSLAFVVFLAMARTPQASPPPGQFAERVEPVVLQGAQLEGLLGADLEGVSVFAADERGEIRQIPFQVDERFPGGEYVFIANKLPETGKLTREDELVFMARDAGERLKPDAPVSGSRMIKEVELIDPLTGKRAWAYVAAMEIPQVRSPLHYVVYDPVERTAMGSSYFMAFPAADMPLAKETPWQKISLNVLDREVKDASTRTSVFTPNVLKREFLSVKLSAFGDMARWNLDLKELRAKEVGERIGPIRAIRKFRLRPYLGYGIGMKPVTIVQSLYDQFTTVHVKGDLRGAGVGLMTSMMVSFGEELEKTHAPSKPVSYWQVAAVDELKAALTSLQPDPSCKDCLTWQLDAKKLPPQAFAFEFLRYFPKNNTPQEVQSFERYYTQPLQVRTATLHQNVSLKNFR